MHARTAGGLARTLCTRAGGGGATLRSSSSRSGAAVPAPGRPTRRHAPPPCLGARARRCLATTAAVSSGMESSSPTTAPPADVASAAARIHAAAPKASVFLTGGGAPALAWLLAVPGASATLLEARVPYGGPRAVAAVLGGGSGGASPPPPPPPSLASPAAAAALAVAAYRSAAALADYGTPIIGVGGCGALATSRTRRGSDRFFVATHDGRVTASAGVVWPPEENGAAGAAAFRRAAQDAAAARLVVDALARACGVAGCGGGEGAAWSEAPAYEGDPLSALLAGRISSLELGACPALPGGVLAVVDAPRPGRAYLPGSFNPWHAGHGGALVAGAAAAEAAGGAPPSPPPPLAFELSVLNADKGALPEATLRDRVAQFTEQGGPVAAWWRGLGHGGPPPPVLLTRQPLFAGKARLVSSSPSTPTTWVVGWDTAVRLVDPKYYGGTPAGVAASLAELAARGCRVAVVGRSVAAADGSSPPAFHAWDPTVDVPPEIAALIPPGLFVPVGEAAFRMDVSSTELRAAAAAAAAKGGGGSA